MLTRCGCGLPIAMRTSWTHENPGRKFRACKFYNHETGQRGCTSFEWIDPEPLDWQRDVTNILVAEKHRLATDNHILRSRLNCVEQENRRLIEETEELKKKKKIARKEMSGGHGMVVRDQGNKTVSLVMCVLVSVFVSFVFGKIFG